MDKILHAKSSKGEPYKVNFKISNGVTSILCSCPGAAQKQTCKHVNAFIANDVTMLADSSQQNDLDDLIGALKATTFYEVLGRYDQQLAEIERAKDELNAQRQQVKAMLARELREGLGELRQ